MFLGNGDGTFEPPMMATSFTFYLSRWETLTRTET